MVVVAILPHAEFGPNDHWEDALHFIFEVSLGFIWLHLVNIVISNQNDRFLGIPWITAFFVFQITVISSYTGHFGNGYFVHKLTVVMAKNTNLGFKIKLLNFLEFSLFLDRIMKIFGFRFCSRELYWNLFLLFEFIMPHLKLPFCNCFHSLNSSIENLNLEILSFTTLKLYDKEL